MKFLILLSSFLFLHHGDPVIWETNFDKASSIAKEKHKLILLNFSGSDWCGPCIRLHKEYFEHASFLKEAEDDLVLLNADFPRLKKNKLSKAQQLLNDALADRYNSGGAFPLTLLLTADGKKIRSWEGIPDESPEQFSNTLKKLADEQH